VSNGARAAGLQAAGRPVLAASQLLARGIAPAGWPGWPGCPAGPMRGGRGATWPARGSLAPARSNVWVAGRRDVFVSSVK